MDPRKRAILLLLAVAVLTCGSVGVMVWRRTRPIGVAEQFQRLPERNAIVLYIDFTSLRRGGVLSMLDASKASEDADYREFARQIRFDWREDLDSAMVAFAPNGKYMLVKGRFDWPTLRSYATKHGGECTADGCRLTGSAPDRRISFLPLRRDLMALAVSPRDDWAVHRFDRPVSGQQTDLPEAPVWVQVPGGVLRASENLPSGTRMFAHSMEQADLVTLKLMPEGDAFAARLDVSSRTEKAAADIATDLNRVTVLLREMIEREHQKPNLADLSGVLTSGTFHSEGRRVLGQWPIERSFLQNLLANQ